MRKLKHWCGLVAVAAFVMAVVGVRLGPGATRSRYVLYLTLGQGGSNNRPEKVLTQCTLLAPAGQETSFRSGEQVYLRGQLVDFGEWIRATITPGPAGSLDCVVVLEHTDLLDAGTPQARVASLKAEHEQTIRPGQPVRLPFGPPSGDKWLELTVEPLEGRHLK